MTMNGISKNYDAINADSLSSFANIEKSSEPGLVFTRHVDVEQRLARRLLTTDCLIMRALQSGRNEHYFAVKKDHHSQARLPLAWTILSELLEKPTSLELSKRLAALLQCLQVLGVFGNETRVSIRDYVLRMQLYSLLPLYLRVGQCSFESALDESISFALQALSLIELDRGLEHELFELLGESPHSTQPPCIALENALKVKLGDLANAFLSSANNHLTIVHKESCKQIQPHQSSGYWSIVQQWSEGTAHLRIPSQLSIGKVLWPKVREHWTRLSQALLESDVEVPSDVEDRKIEDDFIEIRNSNDPQLAKTLDIQLQRCRDEHGTMSLVVVKVLEQPDQHDARCREHRLPAWQETIIELLRSATDGQTSRGFLCEAGEITLVIDDLDRNEVSNVMRDILDAASQPHGAESSMLEFPRIPIVCGIACVASPSKRFQIEQLIHAAWRCLDAAKLQGPGAVKSIEVF